MRNETQEKIVYQKKKKNELSFHTFSSTETNIHAIDFVTVKIMNLLHLIRDCFKDFLLRVKRNGIRIVPFHFIGVDFVF